MGKKKDDEPKGGKKGGRAPSEADEEEELDYSKLGPDVAQHKKISNAVFGFTLCCILGAIIVLVFMDLKKAASGKHSTQLGTAKGLR